MVRHIGTCRDKGVQQVPGKGSAKARLSRPIGSGGRGFPGVRCALVLRPHKSGR